MCGLLKEQTCNHTRWIHVWFVYKNTHAMTLAVVHEKNTHAMTLVDPYVVCLEEHTCNDTGCGS